MLDRLPTRPASSAGGVAPDHQKSSRLTASSTRWRRTPASVFTQRGVGKDVSVETCGYYHQIFYAPVADGPAQGHSWRDLRNTHPATEFFSLYSGHPDLRSLEFDLSQETPVPPSSRRNVAWTWRASSL